VSKPEIDFPPDTDPCSPEVYAGARQAFRGLIDQRALVQDARPCFYLYRQVMGTHSQLGLVAAASCEEYVHDAIRKHELTRPDKEDDRVRHIEALDAQTGPVFLLYRARPEVDELMRAAAEAAPAVDFTAADGVRHTGWVVSDPGRMAAIQAAFEAVPRLYIADGHHRCAAAARVYRNRSGEGGSGRFLSVIFPHTALQILPYHRVLKDLRAFGRGGAGSTRHGVRVG
jgi:uncharacterized protein (DUF1015 family)